MGPLWGGSSQTGVAVVDKRDDEHIGADLVSGWRALVGGGADRVMLFPVYGRKVKEGKEVMKVRLVCNGKAQHGAGETYAPTPSR
jgi:hypothetical protein